MSWEQLVSTALLGTDRRPPETSTWLRPAARLAPRTPTEALLGAAALSVAGRSAGARPFAAPAVPAPPPDDEVPAAGPAAAPRLSMWLEGRDRDLVETVLGDLAAAGRRVPDECLPALLDVATRAVLPPELVSAALGRRGRWLATFRPEWAAAVAWFTTDSPEPELGLGPDLGSGSGDADADEWQFGTPAQRLQWLVRMRRRAPESGRDALTVTWGKEKAADRVTFVEALASGLAAPDEPFLEAALTDRSERVRQAAHSLLLTLPGSRLQREIAARATACLHLDSGRLRRARIVVTLPVVEGSQNADDLAAALVAAAPLATWIPLLGGSPAEVVSRPVTGNWRRILHQAWLTAAEREQAADWGQALLAEAGPDQRTDVLPLMAPAARYSLVAEWLRTEPILHPAGWLQTCPAPWPDELAAAVVGLASRARPGAPPDTADDGSLSHSVARLAGLRASPHYGAEVHRVADALPADHPAQFHLSTMATLLTNRYRLLKEIA